MRVVVAGKMPPPIGGQNINIKRLFELFEGMEDVQPLYWEFGFSKNISQFRRLNLGKIFELARVMARLLQLFLKGGRFDYLVFPSGGPHRVPVLRDCLLLPFSRLFCRRVVVHFRAAGIARHIVDLPAWMQLALRVAHRSCWGAISLSEYGRVDPEAVGIRNIFVIPNGVEDHNPSGKSRPSTERVVILNVGHLCADKGTPALLEAFARISPAHPGAVLRLAGECLAPYTLDQLHADIRKHNLDGRVELAGLRTGEELFDEYRRGSLFVFPSVAPYESFGMVLIEAMMFGLPLVVSNWRANTEVATPEFGGITYDPTENHPAALAVALQRALENQGNWPEWGRKNRAVFEGHYTLDRLRDNWRHLLTGDQLKSKI